MPGTNGIEAAEQLGIRGDDRLIFLSGRELEPVGDETVLTKPSGAAELTETVLDAVD